MSTQLVVLGLLREQQLYGYEIKQIIEEHMGDWTNIAFGSIYYALGRLKEEGFVEQVATEQEGNRPSRSVYRITAAGEGEFLRLLREVWASAERQTYALDLGVFFMEALSPGEVLGYLEQRVAALEGALRHLEAHQAEQEANPDVPALARAIFAHSRVHVAAELSWTRELLEQVKGG